MKTKPEETRVEFCSFSLKRIFLQNVACSAYLRSLIELELVVVLYFMCILVCAFFSLESATEVTWSCNMCSVDRPHVKEMFHEMMDLCLRHSCDSEGPLLTRSPSLVITIGPHDMPYYIYIGQIHFSLDIYIYATNRDPSTK